MRVLITGAGGFAGRHLAELCLAQGDEVIGLGRRPADEANPPVLHDYLHADLTRADQALEAVRSAAPDRVFHLAAAASVALSWGDPAGTVSANTTSTVNLLEAVREAAPDARVLVTGSGEEYGEPERLPMEETHVLRPRNPYALSKVCTDLTAGFYADAHGMHVARARAFNHAGPGQSDFYVCSSFARQIATAEAREPVGGRVEVVTGNLATHRDFTDVRDVVRAYRVLLEEAAPDVYNVCSGVSVRTGDILAILARETPIRIEQRTDPGRVRAGEVMDIRGSHDKLTAATGWEPQIPLEQTLRDTLRFWRDRVGVEVRS